jgi:hypothetical protein
MVVMQKTEEIEQLLGLLDAAFAYLNIIYPNDIEKEQARKATQALIGAWRKAKLSMTLKAHVMECHACQFNDQIGTGDKEESFIEQGHQVGAKENSRYAQLSNFVRKTESALNFRSRASHPLVEKQKSVVLNATKRTRNKEESSRHIKVMEKKQKREGYVNNFEQEKKVTT